MCARKMHADEVDTDVPLVRRLLAGQFPHWAHLPIEPVPSAGTDNAIYRLGEDMAVRLPRIAAATGQLQKEARWLPKLAPHLPLAIPTPLAAGAPAEGFPWHWSVYRWLEGQTATIDRFADPRQAAIDLARFVTAMHGIDAAGGPPPGAHNSFRGVPLAMRDESTRAAIASLRGTLTSGAVSAAWEAALRAPAWQGPPVWIHGDLSAGNLLVVRGSLSAVIDFGCLGIGDPACDLMVAWTLFSGQSREAFRAALSVDQATWARGRGWALSWALIFIPYYVETNPVGVASARRTIEEVLAELRSGA
ncbi:MAG TPA: aminoglycoside phosphotransferase family protein [Chloroflexota bacterium]|nr:aminoglycoside phosphotransferase family protein [Chloroflexota bacterium]